ncbi:hypothetical protein C0995_002418 [Termitomyces sp. Mi166|nr:hypothetical protein C0995_002418 [Termitomyces sp. Mi166\
MKVWDFEAHIVVDGKELPEYKFECDAQTRTASCWVPSQAGKPFLIAGMPGRQPDVTIAVKVYADGNYIDGFIFAKGTQWHPAIWSGARISVTSTRPLMFDSIEFTDDDSFLNSTNTKDLGDITLYITQAEIITKLEGYRKLEGESGFINKVHERAKKAVTHKVNLGPETENPAGDLFQVRSISPVYKLIFRYRPIDVLRADGIAPPTPAAHLTEGKRKALCDGPGDDDGYDDEKAAKIKSKKKAKTERPSLSIGEVIDSIL